MICQGTGILAIWHDLDPAGEIDFREWHTRQHMPERLSVPGFLRGCRYIAVQGAPRLFNFYQTETPETLTSAPYVERLNNPTDWTRRVVPYFRNINRSAGRVLASLGAGEGGAIATLRLNPRDTERERFGNWLQEEGLQLTHDQPAIVAVHLWSADPAASLIETTESRSRVGGTAVADWTVAIEGNDAEFVAAAADWLQQQPAFSGALQSPAEVGIYRLQHRIGN
jgi:hypothetical protein